ncbi:hypothetical protein LMG3458_04505 [Achromobacter deleyi]|uniref:Uncharacterized protein n=1 Tax=Achromobacter deleyi TaxID=1353891 RepID=A0A6S7AEV8_9BURK|nr:hypothetical protein [Achromobacter deleyi]CAB3727231.1 hypothetical protein LMG3458_04505 [Achromobacter deleyi]
MTFQPPQRKLSSDLYSLIGRLESKAKRNLIRGYSLKPRLSAKEVAAIRKGNSCADGMLAGAIVKGPNGLKSRKGNKATSSDIYKTYSLVPLEVRAEVCYTVGYVNSSITDSLEICKLIRELSFIEEKETTEALLLLESLSERFGASNFLFFKLAYIRTSRILTSDHLELIASIEENAQHADAVGLQSSALENIGTKLSLFAVASRRTGSMASRIKNGDFRCSIALSNLVPTPVDEADVAGFLLRACESSLVDTIYSFIIILNLENRLSTASLNIRTHLDSNLLKELDDISSTCSGEPTKSIITAHYSNQNSDNEPALDLYRASSAFLERKHYTRIRNDLDRVIGVRLVQDIKGTPTVGIGDEFHDKDVLTSRMDVETTKVLSNSLELDDFYRTYLFLRFISSRLNIIRLTAEDIQFLFDNTTGLEVLLTENELKTLYSTAPGTSKGLVAVLALALYRKKSIDPDVDFDFREEFINYVQTHHNGSIRDFISWLVATSPSVANYLVVSLDEVTLEKLYTLIKSASEASEIRRDILRSIGTKLNRIEYIMEADAIVTRFKVATLQKYFDSSRMYVDGVAMKKWLDANPSIYAEEYRNIYPKLIAAINSANENLESNQNEVVIIKLLNTDHTLISEIFKDAFEEFCLNNEFGIESYLGRRIRHNTLQGVLLAPVDTVFKKDAYRSLWASPNFRKCIKSWMASYSFMLEKLRKEQLQFKSNSSLFNAQIDPEEASTKENILQLTRTLRSAGGAELLNELIIRTCWKQISPQLENASRFITTTLLNEAKESIAQHFFKYESALENNLKADLFEAINGVFRKVASWFQVPQTGFVPASVRELIQIILLDLSQSEATVSWTGECLDKKYTGISVHRIYDCLAVLLQNAYTHGDEGQTISIKMDNEKVGDSLLDEVYIAVTSKAKTNKYYECVSRIERAIQARESGSDMVTEGYSGIKKVKFLSRLSEGRHTVSFSTDAATREISLRFKLRAEISSDSSDIEEAP